MARADPRLAELAAGLERTRARIGAACAAAGRDPSELTLIAVTKTYPASDVLALASLGVTDFGENRDQEAAPKAAEVTAAFAAAGLAAPPHHGVPSSITGPLAATGGPVTWHFIGQLQTNKARSVAGYADAVHSVDRIRLVRALGTAARAVGRDLTCLVQVSLDPADTHPADTHPADTHPADSGTPAGQHRGDQHRDDHKRDARAGSGHERGGVPPARLAELAEAIEAEPGLALGGLMAVAPLDLDPVRAFAPLRRLSAVLRSVNPAATAISAGMSGDLEAAVASGATHLRIGTALLGSRPPVR
jgi:PLP dependent protein